MRDCSNISALFDVHAVVTDIVMSRNVSVLVNTDSHCSEAMNCHYPFNLTV